MPAIERQGVSASSRHRLICKIGNGRRRRRLKVIVEFSRALERARWERRETAEGGKEGRQKDLNSQDGGPSCVTSNCDEFKNVGSAVTFGEGGGGRRMGTALAKRNLSRILLPSALLFRGTFD